MTKFFEKDQNLELERLRIGLLYKQGISVQAGGLLNVLIYIGISADTIPFTSILIWAICFSSIYFARVYGQRWFYKNYVDKKQAFNPLLWERIFSIGTFLGGICWALASTILLPSDLTHQAFLGFLLAGTTAGAAVAYCTSPLAMQTFLLPSILPFALHLTLAGDKYRYAMAALLFLYVGILHVLMRRTRRDVLASFRLQFEKDHLLKQLQETQSKVVHSAKMAALGIMAGGISHEINNPLSAIRLNNSSLKNLALAKNLDAESVLEVVDSIDQTVVRMAKIIAGLKAFARDGKQDEMESVPIHQIISETLDFCYTRFKNNGVQLSVCDASPDIYIHCRRVQIGQVLLNLLNNAFDAVHGQAKPWVKVEITESPESFQISVTDSGPGIPPEVRDKLMQPFFTTKDVGKGTGLGLSIADGIIRSHGGCFVLDTEAKNTRFVFRLPRVNSNKIEAA